MPILGTITADARIIMDAIRSIRNGVQGGGAAMRDAYLQVGRVYMGFIRGRFVGASGGDGTWDALSPFTIARRLASGFGDSSRNLFGAFHAQHRLPGSFSTQQAQLALLFAGDAPILIQSGRLFRSLIEGGPEHIEEVLPDGIRKGTGVFYAAYHQAGGGRLPQREILVPPDGPTSAVIARVFIAGLTSSALGRSLPTTALAA